MSSHTANNASELRAVLGYWDDAAGSRVLGTAVRGDVVTTTATGSIDLGATDSVLTPAAGVHWIGPGAAALTIKARLYVRSTGGPATVSRVDQLTLDVAGQPNYGHDGAGGYGGHTFRDVSLVCRGLRSINSAQAGGGNNNLTVVSSNSVDPIEAVFFDLVSENANADGVSAHGNNALSRLRVVRGAVRGHGANAADQCVTPHGGFRIDWYGGEINAEGTSNQLAVRPGSFGTGSTPIAIYNASVTGLTEHAERLEGCRFRHTRQGTPGAYLTLRCGTMRDCILDDGTLAIDSLSFEWPAGAIIERCWVSSSDTSSTVINSGSGNADRIAMRAIDSVAIGGRRGFDLRGGLPGQVSIAGSVAVMDAAGQFGGLIDAADNGITTGFQSNKPGNGISYSTSTPSEATLAAKRKAIRVGAVLEPDHEAYARQILDEGGWPLSAPLLRNAFGQTLDPTGAFA